MRAPAANLLFVAVFTAAAGFMSREKPGDAPVDFQRDVRPLLADRCFSCHGPDEAARKENLRLDLRESATALKKHGVAVEPGKPEESLMIEKIYETDAAQAMPPPDSGRKPLSPAEKEILRKWIAQGAKYEAFWAFVAPKKPAVPPVKRADWPKGEIDRFVLSSMEREGFSPSPPADRATLARRVAFDLTGLPLDTAELDRYLSDANADAYEKLVDRLLASSAYGERMAADWLDLARYADTYGYQADAHRDVWPYRNWVIRQFNENLPYDDFMTWQIAGDLLPHAKFDQVLGTAFQRMHRQTNEGGSTEEEFRVEYVSDRVHTFGTTFLGLTIECARCHDHKFDPLTQQDYYNLCSFFGNIDESGLYSYFTNATPTPVMTMETPEQKEAIERAQSDVESAIQALRIARIEAEVQLLREPAQPPHQPREIVGLEGMYHFDKVAEGKLQNEVSKDKPGIMNDGPAPVPGVAGKRNGALQLSGDNNAQFPGVGEWNYTDPFSLSLWIETPDRKERAVVLKRSRAWTDAGSQGYQILIEKGKLSFALVHFWPGDAICIETEREIPVGEWTHAAVSNDGSGAASGLKIYLNGKVAPTRVVRDCLTKSITGGDPGALTLGERFRDMGFKNGKVADLAVIGREITRLEALEIYQMNAPATPAAEPDPELVREFVMNSSKDVEAAKISLRDARRKLAAARDAVVEMMCMKEMREPRPAYVLTRGRYDQPDLKRPAAARTPAALPPMDPAFPKNRLGLARWLTDATNPLAARVAVNRLWAVCFGRGIVATTENLGIQGAPPSNRELLDWLAVTFVQSGWDIKAMLRRMVTSAAYCQASDAPPEIRERDPENRLLARAPARRLSSEMMRDQMLAVSGLLVNKIGGASVKPYQPPGLWSIGWGGEYQTDAGEGRHRRSLYTYWRRTVPPPNMILFDSTKRDVCVARRQNTNTPLQSLVLMNDPQFVEGAVALGRRAAAGGGADDAEKLKLLFRTVCGRAPEPAESSALAELLGAERAEFNKNTAGAGEFLQSGGVADSAPAERAESAAFASVALTILSSDAAVTLR